MNGISPPTTPRHNNVAAFETPSPGRSPQHHQLARRVNSADAQFSRPH